MKFLLQGIARRDLPRNAVEEEYLYHDHRPGWRSLEDIDYRARGAWLRSGSNHRTEGGHLVRDELRRGWFVNVRTLSELLELLRPGCTLAIEEQWGQYDWNPSPDYLVLDLDHTCE